jgi:hypothetical protein
MGYSNSYQSRGISGLSATAVKRRSELTGQDKKNADYCKERMSCIPPANYLLVNNTGEGKPPKCACVTQEQAERASGGVVVRQSTPITPRYTVGTPFYQGVGGLNESFLESLGGLANIAIVGLAIYGGYCLAKKF